MVNLLLKASFSYHPRGVARKYSLINNSNENITNVVFEFINVATETVDYSTPQDTRTITPGNELTYVFDLTNTAITGWYWVRASGQGASGNVYKSNRILMYVDSYSANVQVSAPGFMEIYYKDVVTIERVTDTIYVPSSAGRVIIELDTGMVSVLGRSEIQSGTVNFTAARISIQEVKKVFQSKADLINYMEAIIPDAPNYVADKTAFSQDDLINFYLPFYFRQRQIDNVIQVEYDPSTITITEKRLVPRFGMLTPWTGGGGGGGGGGIIIAIGLLALFDAYLHWHTEKKIEETSEAEINAITGTGKQISKQIEDTAVAIVNSLPDNVFAIPKDQLVNKIFKIGESTRNEITAIGNEAKSAIYGPGKPKKWYENPLVAGAMGFAAGVVLSRR